MADQLPEASLIWVTRIFALNPATILAVFHGKGGNIEVYMAGFHRHFNVADLTDAGRALLVPPPEVTAPRLDRPATAAWGGVS